MRRDPAQTADELLCHLRRVVDIADHGIFKGDPSPGLFKVAAAGIEELLHRPAPVHGHDAAADLVHRRVQRHGERQLQVLPGQPVDLIDQPAGGKADVPHADVQPLGRIDELEEAAHIVIIIQRLADAHEHDVRDGQAGIQLRKQHLIQHFRRLEAADQSAARRGTEGAAHAAADLGGNADRIAVMVAHKHAFHAVSVH